VKKIVIIGGGLGGLYSALKLSETSKYDITILDSSAQFGGSYGSYTYEDGALFDYGIHVIYEAMNEDVDKTLRDIIPTSEWNFLVGNKKDIAGTYYKGKLQEYSHYIDIRSQESQIHQKAIGSFFNNIENEKIEATNVYEYLTNRFGKYITDTIHEDVLQKLYSDNGKNLHLMVSKIVPLERVILYSEEFVKDLMGSSYIRNKIAYPDQLNFDESLKSKQRGLYPKQFGMQGYVNRIVDLLKKRGVKLISSVQIENINKSEDKINSIEYIHDDRTDTIDNISHLHWAIPEESVARFFDFNISEKDKPKHLYYIHLYTNQKPKMGKLYYFYILDKGFSSFRISSYYNYCTDAKTNDGLYPICMEMHFDKEQDKKSLFIQAKKELLSLNVVDKDDNIVYINTPSKSSVFPVPTLKNTKITKDADNHIQSLGIKNMTYTGVCPEKELFFLHDILLENFNQIKDLL